MYMYLNHLDMGPIFDLQLIASIALLWVRKGCDSSFCRSGLYGRLEELFKRERYGGTVICTCHLNVFFSVYSALINECCIMSLVRG